jgi:hypothetical protein
VQDWVASIGLDPTEFGTHSLRRIKTVLIYRRTGNLRAVQLLLGLTKIERTVRYLGIEVGDGHTVADLMSLGLASRDPMCALGFCANARRKCQFLLRDMRARF